MARKEGDYRDIPCRGYVRRKPGHWVRPRLSYHEPMRLLDVSRWLGHKSIDTTADQYGHLVPQAADRASAILDDDFETWSAKS
jgi:integrase